MGLSLRRSSPASNQKEMLKAPDLACPSNTGVCLSLPQGWWDLLSLQLPCTLIHQQIRVKPVFSIPSLRDKRLITVLFGSTQTGGNSHGARLAQSTTPQTTTTRLAQPLSDIYLDGNASFHNKIFSPFVSNMDFLIVYSKFPDLRGHNRRLTFEP